MASEIATRCPVRWLIQADESANTSRLLILARTQERPQAHSIAPSSRKRELPPTLGVDELLQTSFDCLCFGPRSCPGHGFP